MSEGQRVFVILVDDDPDEHFLFRADLEDAGVRFEFEAFTRPEDALAHLKSGPGRPVLIFTDLSLAGSDAVEFIRDVQPFLGGGAVGVYSGARNPEKEAKCRDAGSSFYIVKPVTRDVFEKTVAGLGSMALVEAEGELRLVSTDSEAA
ncbi:response regulator [Maricaulis sp.]|uniref:response regulator n=1 Tax=Maricaulis sp. TaxID=1486257 RepID=UPI002603DE18|nr:response regulator [Maricaulis sp.]